MKNNRTKKYYPGEINSLHSNDHSGSDCNNDKTETAVTKKRKSKFDKPKREVDPDTTGIDINSDKTQKRKISRPTKIEVNKS